MRFDNIEHAALQFRILSENQLEELHEATLQILERTGVAFECEEAIALLGDSGADVSDPDRVKIPSYLVEQAIGEAPKAVTFYNREGEPAFVLNGVTGSHFGASHDPREIQDPLTREIRTCYVEDMADIARLIDALPNIEWSYNGAVNLTLPVTEDNISDRIGVLQFIFNSTKPIISEPNNAASLEELIDLCSIIAGGEEKLRQKPFFGSASEPVSPLIQGKDAMEKSLLCAQKGIPNVVYGMQMAGATAPATFAGCLAIANAEVLSQLVVLQLKSPGAPVIFGGMPSIMDMKTTIYSYGAPEKVLMVGALTELAHYYKLPFFGTGGCTDAQIMGVQAATEATSNTLLSILTGADIVHNVGTTYHGGTRSLDLIVFVNDIIDMIKVITRGIKINEETLPLDLIERIAPKGNYLSDSHTFNHFREFWSPRIFDRSAVKDEGIKDCEELLRERTIEILRTHDPKPLEESLLQEVTKIENSWLRRVGLTEYPKREK
jgi:trimethylamine--corrinoid protein Co-methyltransferase